jgi:hypothetical protein
MENENKSVESEIVDLERPLTYAERQEIKELSKLFLGSSSKWQKLVNKGHLYPVTGEDGKPVMLNDDVKKPLYLMENKRVNPIVLLEQLRNAKKQREAQIEARRREQEVMRAAQEASGSHQGSV